MKKVYKKLRAWGIDKDSDYGKAIIKLDKIYEKIENIDEQIRKLMVYKDQFQEDADYLENSLMYKFNKDARKVDILDIKNIKKK